MYKIYIFTEALSNTGLGHLGRCTALAEILLEEGKDVSIVLHSDGTSISGNSNIPIYELNWKNRALLQNFLESNRVETAYIDSYLAESEIYELIASNVSKLICIDDMNRMRYPKGATILNPGFAGKYMNYDKTRNPVLTGLEYVLLRKPFRENFSIPEQRDNSILVTVGGEDRWNIVPRITELLSQKFPLWKKNLVIGPAFLNLKEIESKADSNTKLHQNLTATEMRDLMLDSKFAITAGGQTTYELNRCKVPMIIIETADNQRGNIRGWIEEKGVLFAGEANAPELLDRIKDCLSQISL